MTKVQVVGVLKVSIVTNEELVKMIEKKVSKVKVSKEKPLERVAEEESWKKMREGQGMKCTKLESRNCSSPVQKQRRVVWYDLHWFQWREGEQVATLIWMRMEPI